MFSLSNKMILHYFHFTISFFFFFFLGYKNNVVLFYYYTCLVHLMKWYPIIFIFYFFRLQKWCIILLDKLNMHDKFMWHLTERDNYNKPIWGMARFHFAYLWCNHLHFAYLRLVLLAFRNPPFRLPLEKYIFRQKQI